jgi:hypothetical protein
MLAIRYTLRIRWRPEQATRLANRDRSNAAMMEEFEGFAEALAVAGVIGLAVGVLALAVLVVSWIFICSKAGYSRWLGLLMLVPLVNVIFFLYFAFARWPILKGQQESAPAPVTASQQREGTTRPKPATAPAACLKCGAPLGPNERFCGECGSPRPGL